jgi:hypothetical protein
MQGTAGGRKDTSIVLEGLLGEGTFGKVYKGAWCCAVMRYEGLGVRLHVERHAEDMCAFC